ncbi:MAG: TrbG/VirB9 family P-type conjugative transfer protein [Fusobacterium mortiferum]|nr:TrbG/VirB9 family P-type conjugative transfer protein [Fusobacterium mortiferum]
MKKLIIFMIVLAANSFAAELNQDYNKAENKVVKTTTTVKKPVSTIKTKKTSKIVSLKKEAYKRQYERIVYREGKIYEIYGEPLMATAVIFGEDEKIKSILLSDPIGWKATINENQVYIKPEEVVSKSTMFVTTTKRTYFFNLHSDGSGAYNPVIQFMFPEEQQALIQNYQLMKEEEENKRISLSVGNIEDLNNRYSWNKKYSWSPTNIVDDGEKTYIFLSLEDKDVPTFYIRKDKELEICLFRIKENKNGQKVIIVDKTFKEGILTLHKKTITITNKARKR